MEAVDEGLLDARTVLLASLNHHGDDDVRELCEANDFFEHEDDESEDDPQGDDT